MDSAPSIIIYFWICPSGYIICLLKHVDVKKIPLQVVSMTALVRNFAFRGEMSFSIPRSRRYFWFDVVSQGRARNSGRGQGQGPTNIIFFKRKMNSA